MNETTAFWSGHANSSAMVLRMIEMKQAPDRVVHAVTRAEFGIVYEFMEKFQKVCEVEIIFEDMAIGKPDKEFKNFFNKSWCRGITLEPYMVCRMLPIRVGITET